MKYKLGDRVTAIDDFMGKKLKGEKGRIIEVMGFGVSVEFDNNIEGHSCGGRGKEGHCWSVSYKTIEIDKPQDMKKIVIITNGKETLARLYDGKKVIKSASAKCSPDDEFDFEIGAKIAFERLIGEKPIEAPKLVIEIGKKYMLKSWEDVTEPHALSEDIWKRDFSKPVEVLREHDVERGVFFVKGKTDSWWVKASSFLCEHTEKFIPHLWCIGDHHGNIGEPTKYKDAVGRPLCIGDVVELFGKGKSHGLTAVVRTEINRGKKRIKTFIMGIEMCCDDHNGTIEDWSIIKTRDFSEVKNGEEIDGIKYVTKE